MALFAPGKQRLFYSPKTDTTVRTILKIIVWTAFIVYAIHFLHKQALEIGLPAFIFGVPAVVIGAAIIYAIFRKDDKKNE